MSRIRRSIIQKARRAIEKTFDALAIPSTASQEEGVIIEYDNGDRTPCPDCGGIDPINGRPLDPNCTTCNGLGYPYSRSTVQIAAIVSHIDPTSSTRWGETAAGRFEVGDVYLSCKLTDVLIDPSNKTGPTYFDKATKVTIQNVPYKVKHNPIKRGIAGDLFTVSVYLTRDEGAGN
jgi:hypothetical protein